MVTFEHLEKTETISAHGDESNIDWDGAGIKQFIMKI